MPGKAPIYKLFCSKASKTEQTCGYRHTGKTRKLFWCHRTCIDNFANLDSFAKFSVPVGSIISCSNTEELWSYSLYKWCAKRADKTNLSNSFHVNALPLIITPFNYHARRFWWLKCNKNSRARFWIYRKESKHKAFIQIQLFLT